MDESTKEALQAILRFLSEHPEAADRIDVTFRPGKLLQGSEPKDDKDKS